MMITNSILLCLFLLLFLQSPPDCEANSKAGRNRQTEWDETVEAGIALGDEQRAAQRAQENNFFLWGDEEEEEGAGWDDGPLPPLEPDPEQQQRQMGQPAETAHLFVLVWPPAYGRSITCRRFYRETFRSPEERQEALDLAAMQREAFQPVPPTDPQAPPTPWMLLAWLPANCSRERELAFGRRRNTRRARMRRELPLKAAKIRQIDRRYGHNWLEAATINRQEDPGSRLRNALYRRRWGKVAPQCGLTNPTEYFRIASETVSRWFPVREWLEAMNIRPDDHQPFWPLHDGVEGVFWNAIGWPRGAFRLFCLDLNRARPIKWHWEEFQEEGQPLPPLIEENGHHPVTPTMLHTVLLCVDADWEGPHEAVRYVACPLGAVERVAGPLMVPCPGPDVAYYRTLDDGIDGPFVGEAGQV